MLSLMYTIWNPTEENISKHVDTWMSYSKETRKQFEVILIDDCSDETIRLDDSLDINLTVARITDDIFWNICGAKNLGFHLAQGPWVFASEQDHFFASEGDLLDAIGLDKKRGTVYNLQRYRPVVLSGAKDKPHPNTFIMHKDDFDDIGGYDEDFSGHRGHSDAMIREQMKRAGYNQPLIDINLIAYIEFSCVDPLNKKDQWAHRLFNRKLAESKIAQLNRGAYVAPKRLRFNWEITQQQRIG